MQTHTSMPPDHWMIYVCKGLGGEWSFRLKYVNIKGYADMLEQSNEKQETHEGTTPLHHCISPYLNSDLSPIKHGNSANPPKKKRETENLRHAKVRLNQSESLWSWIQSQFTGLDFAPCGERKMADPAWILSLHKEKIKSAFSSHPEGLQIRIALVQCRDFLRLSRTVISQTCLISPWLKGTDPNPAGNAYSWGNLGTKREIGRHPKDCSVSVRG